MTTYSMTPILSGTRMRVDHNTFAAVITSFSMGQLVVGDELWEAPADGPEVKKGDKWLKVTSVDGVNVPVRGWMAYIHKTYPICSNFKIIDGEPSPPPPPTEPMPFPSEFTLTNPDGSKARYVLDRILE